jgi:hypothetical protein
VRRLKATTGWHFKESKLFKVTYKEPAAIELQVKYFKNRQVADTFVTELKSKFISLEEVEDVESE